MQKTAKVTLSLFSRFCIFLLCITHLSFSNCAKYQCFTPFYNQNLNNAWLSCHFGCLQMARERLDLKFDTCRILS